MEKISFCVTFYNQESFVKQCIDSILAINTKYDFEILVGDDGSTDGTVNLIKDYQLKFGENKIKLFVQNREPNKKYNTIHRASQNRLNLLTHATGQFLMFIDGDDCLCSTDFIDDDINILTDNQDLVCVAHNFKYIYIDKPLKIANSLNFKGKISSKNYIKKYYIHSGAILFKNVIDKNIINLLKKYNCFDDNIITISHLCYGNLYYDTKPIYVYNQHEDSIWNTMEILEQNILNTMDYDIVSIILPKFSNYMFRRQLLSILKVYQKRNSIEKIMDKNIYYKYLNEVEKMEYNFTEKLLKWNQIKLKEKILFHFELLRRVLLKGIL